VAVRKTSKLAGLAVFECPRRPGNLLLTTTTCAASHKMAQGSQDEAKVRRGDRDGALAWEVSL
jgi:hypothetical protein